MAERRVVDGKSSRESEMPTRLVEHLGARYVWFGGCVALAVVLVISGVVALGSPSDVLRFVVYFGSGVGILAAGVLALRMGVVADRDAVTITNVSRHIIPWADLEDITLISLGEGIDTGERFMLFTCREGRAVVAAAPSGRNRPGRRLPRVQHDLLAMRDRYAPPSP